MALLGELGYALIAAPRTLLGGILPDVIIEEIYRDTLIITDHPVEIGAAITDHAFKRPATIDIRAGFSNSSAGTEGYIEAMYAAILELQASRQPFVISTPRRRYKDMLIQDIIVTRDDHTNSVLALTISCRQVILVSTKQQKSSSGGSGGGSNQSEPQRTGPVSEGGTKQTINGQSFAGNFAPGYNTSFGLPNATPVIGGTPNLVGQPLPRASGR